MAESERLALQLRAFYMRVADSTMQARASVDTVLQVVEAPEVLTEGFSEFLPGWKAQIAKHLSDAHHSFIGQVVDQLQTWDLDPQHSLGWYTLRLQLI